MAEIIGRREESLTAALKEFEVLRKEISDRSSAQTTILNLNLAALSTITTLVLAQKANSLVLLVLPLIASCFGMLYFDHAANIDQIGRYIREDIKPIVVSLTENDRLMSYEERVRARELRFLPRGLSMGLPLLLMFTGFPVAGLVRVLQNVDQGWSLALWWAGLAIECIFALHWVSFIRRPFVAGKR